MSKGEHGYSWLKHGGLGDMLGAPQWVAKLECSRCYLSIILNGFESLESVARNSSETQNTRKWYCDMTDDEGAQRLIFKLKLEMH